MHDGSKGSTVHKEILHHLVPQRYGTSQDTGGLQIVVSLDGHPKSIYVYNVAYMFFFFIHIPTHTHACTYLHTPLYDHHSFVYGLYEGSRVPSNVYIYTTLKLDTNTHRTKTRTNSCLICGVHVSHCPNSQFPLNNPYSSPL